jgi:hypothetical protein
LRAFYSTSLKEWWDSLGFVAVDDFWLQSSSELAPTLKNLFLMGGFLGSKVLETLVSRRRRLGFLSTQNKINSHLAFGFFWLHWIILVLAAIFWHLPFQYFTPTVWCFSLSLGLLRSAYGQLEVEKSISPVDEKIPLYKLRGDSAAALTGKWK